MSAKGNDGGVDVEEVKAVAVPWSMSLRQLFALFIALYFGCTGSLFLLVERELAAQSRMPVTNIQPSENQTQETPVPEQEELPQLSPEDLAAKKSEQVLLEPGKELFVAHGDVLQATWVGDRYAILFSREGWSRNGSTLFVTYSRDCVNWSEPLELARMGPTPMISGGIKGSLIRAANGTFILVLTGGLVGGGYGIQLFTSTSEDGKTWSSPGGLPRGAIGIFDVYGISLMQDAGGSFRIAFSGDFTEEGSVVATMDSSDGVTWTQPTYAKTPKSHEYPENYLYSFGAVSITEVDGERYIAHVDNAGDVWVGPRKSDGWDIVQATPHTYFSYYHGASMIHLVNESTIVAFDHLNNVYLVKSNDTLVWGQPVWASSGQTPFIAPVGSSTFLLAYNGGGGIYVRLLATGPTKEPEEQPGLFQVTFIDSMSDLFSNDTFVLTYNSSKAGSSIDGWDDDRHDYLLFDSTEGNFTLFGQPRQGWLPRIHKDTQSSGSIVWRLSLKYRRNETVMARLNVYAGGTFGSDSTWDYSQSEDSWTVHFANAECEEIDLGTGDFTYVGKISFTMVVTGIGGNET